MKCKIPEHFPFNRFLMPGKIRYFLGKIASIPNVNKMITYREDYHFKTGIAFSNYKEGMVGKELYQNGFLLFPGDGIKNDFSVHANRYFDFMIKQLTDQFKDK